MKRLNSMETIEQARHEEEPCARGEIDVRGIQSVTLRDLTTLSPVPR